MLAVVGCSSEACGVGAGVGGGTGTFALSSRRSDRVDVGVEVVLVTIVISWRCSNRVDVGDEVGVENVGVVTFVILGRRSNGVVIGVVW